MKNSVKVSSLTKNLLLKAGIASQADEAPVQIFCMDSKSQLWKDLSPKVEETHLDDQVLIEKNEYVGK